ncbi:MAG: S1 RNA-binding domain-containing protein, partial [Oscillospiraceae bacterium]|nr:S1 RNA-binding domain-containing protein [Oscillospiraceae bacterium]
DVVKVGDPLDVYVLSFDKEKGKISLGHKDPNQNPWKTFTDKYEKGSVAKVKVVKLMAFGAFAEIVPGVDGLIHISQIADKRIGKPEEFLSEGQEVEVQIIDIDYEKKNVSLSIRALTDSAAGVPSDAEAFDEGGEDGAVVYDTDINKPEPEVEEIAVEEVVAEAPAVEEAPTEEPVAEEPVAEEPVAEEPVAEEPAAEEPPAEEPSAE